jgi:mannosyltransferase
MGRKREDRGKEKRSREKTTCSLDGDYLIPVRSFQDLTADKIRQSIISSRYIQLLLCLTLIGFFLRFYNLGYNSLWLDEASTLTIAVNSIPDIWQTTMAGEFNPPLFYWTEHLLLVFGNSEVVLRFIPALLGVLTIPLIYLIGKEFMDRNVGIIAAAAFALSPFLIYYSQEARAYSMMLFLVASAMVFYLKALKSNNRKDWALFGILSALAFWAHFYALVIIGALVLYALYIQIPEIRMDPGLVRPLVIAGGIFCILCLPLIIVTIQLFAKRTASAPTFGFMGLDLIIATFAQISGSEPAMYLFLLLFIAGLIQAFIIDKNKGIFLLSLSVLTFVISYVLSYRIPMQPRYLIFLAIIFFITIAMTYTLFYSLIRSSWIVYGFILLFVIVNTSMLAGYYSGYVKEDWRGFSGQLQQLTRPGDIVVDVPMYIAQPLDYYYSNTTDQTIELGAYTADDLKAIEAQKKNNTIFYVVTADIQSANPGGDALAWLQEHTKSAGGTKGVLLLTST